MTQHRVASKPIIATTQRRAWSRWGAARVGLIRSAENITRLHAEAAMNQVADP